MSKIILIIELYPRETFIVHQRNAVDFVEFAVDITYEPIVGRAHFVVSLLCADIIPSSC
jgi:hypothetical protein